MNCAFVEAASVGGKATAFEKFEKRSVFEMAKEVEYRQIKGRDEEIPVFGNLSRSVVKRGADKIYWRLKDVRAKRFGSWDDDVWLDCETGDIRFG